MALKTWKYHCHGCRQLHEMKLLTTQEPRLKQRMTCPVSRKHETMSLFEKFPLTGRNRAAKPDSDVIPAGASIQ